LLVGIRLLGLAAMGGVLAFVINPELMRWAAFPLPDWLRWCGVGLGFLAFSSVVTRRRHTLVTSGPYR